MEVRVPTVIDLNAFVCDAADGVLLDKIDEILLGAVCVLDVPRRDCRQEGELLRAVQACHCLRVLCLDGVVPLLKVALPSRHRHTSKHCARRLRPSPCNHRARHETHLRQCQHIRGCGQAPRLGRHPPAARRGGGGAHDSRGRAAPEQRHFPARSRQREETHHDSSRN